MGKTVAASAAVVVVMLAFAVAAASRLAGWPAPGTAAALPPVEGPIGEMRPVPQGAAPQPGGEWRTVLQAGSPIATRSEQDLLDWVMARGGTMIGGGVRPSAPEETPWRREMRLSRRIILVPDSPAVRVEGRAPSGAATVEVLEGALKGQRGVVSGGHLLRLDASGRTHPDDVLNTLTPRG
jgi:hypothetical protein